MFTSISCSVRWGECAGAATVLWSVYRDESVLCLETISFPGRGCKSVPAVKGGGGARVPRTKGGTVKFAKTCQMWWISCGSAPSQVLVRRLRRLPEPDSVWHCVVIICLQNQLRRRSTTTCARHNAVHESIQSWTRDSPEAVEISNIECIRNINYRRIVFPGFTNETPITSS